MKNETAVSMSAWITAISNFTQINIHDYSFFKMGDRLSFFSEMKKSSFWKMNESSCLRACLRCDCCIFAFCPARGIVSHLFSAAALFAPLVPFCAAFMFLAYNFMSFYFRPVCGFLCPCKRPLSLGVCLYACGAFVASGGAVGLVAVLSVLLLVYMFLLLYVFVYLCIYMIVCNLEIDSWQLMTDSW